MATPAPDTMNKLWQQLAIATNWPVLAAIAVLSSLGLITIWADTPGDGVRQLVFLGVAVLCMTLFQAVNYQRIGKLSWGFYVFSLLLVFYTVIGSTRGGADPIPFVHRVNGAYNWIKIGAIGVQPAELAKIGFILVLARYLRFRNNYRTFKGLLPPFGLALAPLVLILKQPDLGTALVFIPVLFAMLFVAGAKIKHLLAIVLMGAALAPVAWLAGKDENDVPFSRLPGFKYLPTVVKKYQRDRVNAMFTGEDNDALMKKDGYQVFRAMVAMGSGGPTGKGPGNIPVGRHVPEAHNDMIFALIGEQFGFLGSAVVLGAYIVLFAAGIEISSATREPFGKLIALGIVAMLAGQTFLNLMVATKLMPVTGVTLPFVSYGGSSLLASYMAAGLLLNVGQNRPIVMAREAFEY
jgi:cell division protein FtsW (lipid II flippase)